jgi:hypothetical protein
MLKPPLPNKKLDLPTTYKKTNLLLMEKDLRLVNVKLTMPLMKEIPAKEVKNLKYLNKLLKSLPPDSVD